MKTKIGRVGIFVCLILWLSTHSSQAHCHELITTKSIEQDAVPSSVVEENRHQDYLASFHGINQLLLNQEVIKNAGQNEVIAAPKNLSLLGSNQPNTHRALAHHVYVRTESDIEKLLLQFPLKQNINSTQRLSVESLLEQIIEFSSKSIHMDLLNLDLIKDSAAYRVTYDDSRISELVFEFDLTQQGLVHKGKIVSLFFHYLQEYLHTNNAGEDLTTLTNNILSIESMRLWHFSNDQLTKNRLTKTKTNYLIKPFSTYDFRLFKQKYPKSVGHYFLDQQQSNLIYNQSGLNIWLSSEKNKKTHANSYKIYLRGNNYLHNIENYISLNLLLIALNKGVLESTLSTDLPFAVELSNKTNNDLLSTLEVFKQFTIHKTTFEEVKIAYIKQINQEKSLKNIALIELDKATLSTVNLWPQKAVLEAINSIELEQITDFHEQFLKSLSIDIVLSNDKALAQLPIQITALKQLFTLDNPNGHLNHYNQYYTPAVGTLLNKRLHIDGDKNFLLDVYVSPTKTLKQELSIQIIVATLRSLLNEEASWLKASFKRVNAFPSIYFHVDGDLNNMGEVKEAINKLVLSLKPKVKSYILNNFKKLRDKHFNDNSSAKYAIRPSDVMRIYDDIFLEHNIENILIQLNGKQNQTQFFVALAGERVH